METRLTNRIVAQAPFVIAFLFLAGAIGLAIFLAPRVERKGTSRREQARLRDSIEKIHENSNISSLNTRIQMIDSELKVIDAFSESDKKLEESAKKLGKTFPKTEFMDRGKQRTELLAKRDELIRQVAAQKQSASQPIEEKSFFTRIGGWGVITTMIGLLSVLVFGLQLVRIGVWGVLPERNPLSLTERERRNMIIGAGLVVIICIIFVAFFVILGSS